jgi:alkyl hydroperoxide reductase subunit AhpC
MGQKITFPIVADLNKEAATKFSLLMPGESKTKTRLFHLLSPSAPPAPAAALDRRREMA